jgi:hypothetical protein
MSRILFFFVVGIALFLPAECSQAKSPRGFGPGKGSGTLRQQVQDKVGGVPATILKRQSLAEISPPSLEKAIAEAIAEADETARPYIDFGFFSGTTRYVPKPFKTIQEAIDASRPGDVVVVRPGTYFEQIVMKNGIKLMSAVADQGDKMVSVAGAYLKLPQRTVRTIIDGSKSQPSHRGIIDFNPGVGPKTIIDGFTIQNLPKQDHHVPGHAHAINVRGASPVILNCYVRNNGSTGIGNHVVYTDQDSPVPERDFRWANVQHWVEAVIYRNIICQNVGLGIGCNHFSTPRVLGNEVFENTDVELGHALSPGIGAKHGAAPIIKGNIVHHNPGGGILSKLGAPQGRFPIDRPSHPTIARNVVFDNGDTRPAIACDGAGSNATPVCFVGNYVFNARAIGIALKDGAYGLIQENMVVGSEAPGIAIDGATARKLNYNKVIGSNAPGFVIKAGSNVLEMVGNAAQETLGPRFMLRNSTIADPSY